MVEIYSAIAYSHRQAINGYLDKRQQQAQQQRQQLAQNHNLMGLRDRLLARRQEQTR